MAFSHMQLLLLPKHVLVCTRRAMQLTCFHSTNIILLLSFSSQRAVHYGTVVPQSAQGDVGASNLQFVSIQDKLKQEIRHLKGERSASPRYVYAASCCVFYMFSIVTRVACEKMP